MQEEINALIKYLDPDNDGDMERDELENAMRKADLTIGRLEIKEQENLRVAKKVAAADKAMEEASKTPKLEFTSDEINSIADYLDPSKVSERSERALWKTRILEMNYHPRNGYRHNGYIHHPLLN